MAVSPALLNPGVFTKLCALFLHVRRPRSGQLVNLATVLHRLQQHERLESSHLAGTHFTSSESILGCSGLDIFSLFVFCLRSEDFQHGIADITAHFNVYNTRRSVSSCKQNPQHHLMINWPGNGSFTDLSSSLLVKKRPSGCRSPCGPAQSCTR